MTSFPRLATALLAFALAACGQKGPLYLPDTTQGEVVTRPTQTPAETSNTPATPDAPVGAPPASDPDKDKKNGATPPK